jgi:hypothetical protein
MQVLSSISHFYSSRPHASHFGELPVEFALNPGIHSMSSHQAEKNHHVDKQIEILRLIALCTTGLMMARGLV